MPWTKLGRICEEQASYPTVDEFDAELRLYFARRDATGRSHVLYLSGPSNDPLSLRAASPAPLLELGPPGSFDADGHAPRWILEANGERWLFLIGWNRSSSVPYHLSIGCARSIDGRNWRKVPGPIMDRCADEPFFSTSPCVLYEHGLFRMWYTSGTGWEWHDGQYEPLYGIRYAESRDGLHWERAPHSCLNPYAGADALAWPVVWREGEQYRMYFCHRGRKDFRDNPRHAYRIGMAHSHDGLNWEVLPRPDIIEPSQVGWDSAMVTYPARYRDFLFYNGNGFGATGVGVAVRAA